MNLQQLLNINKRNLSIFFVLTLHVFVDAYLFANTNDSLEIEYYNRSITAVKEKNIKDAWYYNNLAIQFCVNNNTLKSMPLYTNVKGLIHLISGRKDSALFYFDKAYAEAKANSDIHVISKISNESYTALENINDVKNAFKFYTIFLEAKDSILTNQNAKVLKELSLKYETEKKSKDIEIKSKENEIQNLAIKENKEKESERIIRLVMVSLIILLFLYLIYYMILQYRKSRKLNNELSAAKEKELVLNEVLETDLKAAAVVQNKLLTNEKDLLHTAINDAFVLFKPKDKVSGDFVWSFKTNDSIYIVLADCTGHGVPGAFMSMIGIALLNKVVKLNLSLPLSELLLLLDATLLKMMGANNDAESEGMELSLVKVSNDKIELALAGQNAYVVNQLNQLNVIKGGFIGLGGMMGEVKKKFNCSVFNKSEIKSLYFTSDGLTDQHGADGKTKFSSKRLETFILENSNSTCSEQINKLTDSLQNWMGAVQQKDDITVVGLRF